MQLEIISKNEKQTILAASKFAETLKVPSVVSLEGELGAGKTTFAKGVALGLGIKDIITSPTFTLLNEYKEGNVNLYHFDLYRLSSDEGGELGFEDYFDNKKLDGITLVEWAENMPEILPKIYFKVIIIKLDNNSRKIIIKIID